MNIFCEEYLTQVSIVVVVTDWLMCPGHFTITLYVVKSDLYKNTAIALYEPSTPTMLWNNSYFLWVKITSITYG